MVERLCTGQVLSLECKVTSRTTSESGASASFPNVEPALDKRTTDKERVLRGLNRDEVVWISWFGGSENFVCKKRPGCVFNALILNQRIDLRIGEMQEVQDYQLQNVQENFEQAEDDLCQSVGNCSYSSLVYTEQWRRQQCWVF